MRTPPPDPPDLAGVIASANAAGLRYVIIGGFAVIAHQYVRATEDTDLLISDDPADIPGVVAFLDRVHASWYDRPGEPTESDVRTAHHLRVVTRHGVVDLMRGGEPPLDFTSVHSTAFAVTYEGETALVASLASLVGFKRLAGRPKDRLDLEELERIHGPLPQESIPGLDD